MNYVIEELSHLGSCCLDQWLNLYPLCELVDRNEDMVEATWCYF
jgi:hypothetical protein